MIRPEWMIRSIRGVFIAEVRHFPCDAFTWDTNYPGSNKEDMWKCHRCGKKMPRACRFSMENSYR